MSKKKWFAGNWWRNADNNQSLPVIGEEAPVKSAKTPVNQGPNKSRFHKSIETQLLHPKTSLSRTSTTNSKDRSEDASFCR